jgi:ferredoxin
MTSSTTTKSAATKRQRLLSKIQAHGRPASEADSCKQCVRKQITCLRADDVSKKCLACVRCSSVCEKGGNTLSQRVIVDNELKGLKKRRWALVVKEARLRKELEPVEKELQQIEEELVRKEVSGCSRVLDLKERILRGMDRDFLAGIRDVLEGFDVVHYFDEANFAGGGD